LIVEPAAGMGPIYSIISGAEHTLDMTMYELSDPQADQLLISDRDRGVAVRVLLDQDYEGATANQAAYAQLSAAGVQIRWAPSSVIFHQKTITVDGSLSVIMTGNLTSQYYAATRDFALVDRNAADVAAVEQTFDSDWSGAPVGPGGPGADLVWSPGSEIALVDLIDSAQHSISVENEEMASSAITDALGDAARRGVDVTVTMTADPSWDSAFDQLSGAGVHVGTYPDNSSALYIHAKAIVVDGTTAFVGSENFSTPSLDYNRELGVITTDSGVVSGVSSTLAADASGSAPWGG
jgi:phosphatidylserine/phosphatidylglycerophosphate/cardiolipin synthase-like enzyme